MTRNRYGQGRHERLGQIIVGGVCLFIEEFDKYFIILVSDRVLQAKPT